MPQKAKFSKEEIVEAGIKILRKDGPEAVTARAIGDILNSSARPIFTVFESMGEVLEGIKERAMDIYTEYVNKGLSKEKAFKGVGEEYIRFSKEEPKLFQFLFMNKVEKTYDISNILPGIDDNYEKILKSITDEYPVKKEDALSLYKHLWVYSHGIATLIASGMCDFSDGEIGDMLTEVFKAILIEKMKGR